MNVFVDYAQRSDVAAMKIAGMTVAERVLREAAKAGASRAVIRAERLPPLPALPIDIECIGPAAPPPTDATPIRGDVIAGVTISDEATRRRARSALLQSLRRPHDGLADRYVIRAMSVRLTGLVARVATPNQITFINIVVGFAACAMAAAGWFALAGALMILQLVLDSVDGELARLRFMHSKFGMALDNISDDIIDNLFIAMLGVGIGGIWAPIGIACGIARGLSAVMIHIDVARAGKLGDVLAFKWWFDSADAELTEVFEHDTSPLGIARAFGRRDLYGLVFGVSCLIGLPLIALGLAIAISVAYFALAIIHIAVTARH